MEHVSFHNGRIDYANYLAPITADLDVIATRWRLPRLAVTVREIILVLDASKLLMSHRRHYLEFRCRLKISLRRCTFRTNYGRSRDSVRQNRLAYILDKSSLQLTPSMPAVPNCYCLKCCSAILV